MELTQDFREFINLLNLNNVRYLITGGYAVALYGYPRHTGDIDFWVENSAENADKLVNTILQFGFGALDINKEDFIKPDFIIQLGFPPNRIDIITGISGVEFLDCWEERNPIVLDGMSVNFIPLHKLLINKQASGRNKDRVDIEMLNKTLKKKNK